MVLFIPKKEKKTVEYSVLNKKLNIYLAHNQFF